MRTTNRWDGLLLLALTLLAGPAAGASGPASAAVSAGDPAARFRDLLDREWAWRLRENPLFATHTGEHAYDDRLPSYAAADLVRREAETKAFLAELSAIDRSALTPAEAVSHELFGMELADRLEARRFGEEELLFNADSGFHTELAQIPDSVPVGTVAELERYLARLRQFPRLFDEAIALLERGLARGMTPAGVAIRGIESTAAAHAVADPEASVFWAPFAALPHTIPEGEKERLRAAARTAIRDAVAPSYAKLNDFLVRRYLPGARTSLGASHLPDGGAYYRYLIRHFTTLELEPEAIHRTGLGEVARIRAEMERVKEKTGFTGDMPAFLAFLRSDPRFYAGSADDLLKEASYIAKRMDAKLPALFGRLPRKPYGVAPVPAALAPKYTSGRYVSAPVGGTQPGWYWVNTYALEKRPLYNLEALTFHEAVPGHHLQGSLAQELEGVPPFRRFLYIDSFGEGWGLYSEWLGVEAGFYTDPYRDFGRLGYEAWRACRLVVDTGLHALGWSRERAMDYLAANTTLPLHEVETEIDRYISWPGQALAYYIGYMKLRELRSRAERELGPAFDVRAFHDAVLEYGTLSLPALDRQIDGYIAREKLAATRPEAASR